MYFVAANMRRLLIGWIITGIVVVLVLTSANKLRLANIPRPPCEDGIWAWRPTAIESLHEEQTPYIFQGLFFIANDTEQYTFQGVKPLRIQRSSCELVLTYRFDHLVPVEMVATRFRVHQRLWQNEGNTVAGLQVDFDSPSAGLGKYAQWLHDLRYVLPEGASVSITGLPDWLVSSPRPELQALASKSDFIAFMMYRGTTPVKDPETYYAELNPSDIRFKIGLLPTQDRNQHLAQVWNSSGYLGVSTFVTK